MIELYDTAQLPTLASPELFRLALDRSLDAATILQSLRDPSGVIVDFTWVYVNEAAAAVLQQPVTALVGHNLLDVLPGNRASGLFARYVQVVETGLAQDGEITYAADGISGWFRNMVVRLGDGVAIFFRDITAEKRTAEALQVSEERRRLAVASAGLGDWYYSVTTQIPELSVQCKRHLGLPPDAVPSLPAIITCLHAEDRVKAGLQLEQALQRGGEFAVTPRVLWPDGSLRWVAVRGQVLPDRPGELVGITLDMTEQVWAERSQHLLAEAGRVLAESHNAAAALERVVRLAIPDLADYGVLYLADSEGGAQRTVLAHRDLLGEALLRELEQRYPFDPAGPSPAAQVLRGEVPVVRAELTDAQLATFARDAGQRTLLTTLGTRGFLVVPLDSAGQRIGALLLATTSSARQYGLREEGLGRALAARIALAIANARLFEAEQAARAAAERAARQRDELLAYIAHDLKNPLTAILGSAQNLQRRLGNPTAVVDIERLRRGLETVETAATSLAAQLNSLQDIAQLQAGRPLELQRRPVDLVDLVRRATAVRQAATDRHQIRVEAEVAQLICEGDPFRIERVLTNLLSNAVKYSPAGGTITLRVARELDDEASWAVVQVADEGVGIAPEDLPHIFERFYRGGNVSRIGGTGLGLASVAAIVEQHGGRVAVTSEPGIGTTVVVRLPAPASPGSEPV
ncbi:MAG: PAS domain-containing protein [Chloroflexales bacterium]|nr:PAS domain-containing protein [Chloroflexales bacterium]